MSKITAFKTPCSAFIGYFPPAITVVLPRRAFGWRNGIAGHQRLSETERNFKRLTPSPILQRRIELQQRTPTAPTEEQISADYRDHWSKQSRTDAQQRLFTCAALICGLVLLLVLWL